MLGPSCESMYFDNYKGNCTYAPTIDNTAEHYLALQIMHYKISDCMYVCLQGPPALLSEHVISCCIMTRELYILTL